MSVDNLTEIKVRDACRLCETKNVPKFTSFLSEAELGKALNVVKNMRQRCCFFGGFSEAERNVLCVCPEWLETDNVEFPITTLEFQYIKNSGLTHRDFLGAVMALGIKKETVGDILVFDSVCYMFVLNTVSEYIISELKKVGSVGVKITVSQKTDFEYSVKTEEKTTTVASLRLDCVVSALCNFSRKNAAELIEQGFVFVNSLSVEKATATVKENDKISVRRHGKFVVCSASDLTKKQRTVLKYKKYL